MLVHGGERAGGLLPFVAGITVGGGPINTRAGRPVPGQGGGESFAGLLGRMMAGHAAGRKPTGTSGMAAAAGSETRGTAGGDLAAAYRQLERLLAGHVLEKWWGNVPGGLLFGPGLAGEVYRYLLQEELARLLVEQGSLGLAEQWVRREERTESAAKAEGGTGSSGGSR